MANTDEPRFWIVDELPPQDEGRAAYGADTVGIADEQSGGIIAYVHADTAARIVRSLSAADLPAPEVA